MELHKHFMNVVNAKSLLLENVNIDIPKVLQDYFQAIKTLDCSKNRLEFLRLILCYKYKLRYENVKNGKCTHSIKFTEFIAFLAYSDRECQLILYDIITLQLVLFEDQKDFISLFEEFHTDNVKNKLLPIDVYLRILVCFLQSWEVLDFLNDVKNLSTNKMHLTSCKKVLLTAVMYDLQTWVQCKESHEWHALYFVLSKVVNITKTTKIINPYLHEILDKHPSLQTISVLFNVIFSTDLKNIEVDSNIVHYASLWILIQEKLVSNQPHERKEALDVFKRLVDFIDLHETDIKKSLASNLMENKVNPFICNKSEPDKLSIKQMVTTFILFMEALEEKQKHLVIPYFAHLDSLIDGWILHKSCGNCFDFSWIYCTFARILEHSNNAIVKWGLLRSLKLNVDAYTYDLFIILIVKSLNHTFLYEKFNDENESEIVTALTDWFNRCQSENLHLIEKFINLSYQVPWGSVPIYHVLHSILSVSSKLDSIVKLEHNEIEIIRCAIARKVDLHPPMLRSISQITLLKILCRFSEVQNIKTLCNALSMFPEEVIKESSCWVALVSWLGKVDYSNAESFITTFCNHLEANEKPCTSIRIFSLIVQLLYEARIICQSEQCTVRQRLVNFLSILINSIDVRPYIDVISVLNVIEFIYSLFGWQRQPPEFIYKIYINNTESLLRFYLKMPNKGLPCKNIQSSAKFLQPVSCFMNGEERDVSIVKTKNSKILERKCIEILDNQNALDLTPTFFALEFWSNVPMTINDCRFFEKVKALIKHTNMLEPDTCFNIYIPLSRLMRNYMYVLPADEFITKIDEFLEIMSNILDSAGNEALIYFAPIMRRCAQPCANDAGKLDKWKVLMRSFIRYNFNSKRDKTFWLVTQKLTECMNSADCLTCKPISDVSKEFTDTMLMEGESLPGLKYILLVSSCISGNFTFFMETLLNGLLHGEVLRRDQRITLQTHIKGKKMISPYKWKADKDGSGDFVAHDFINRQDNVDAIIRVAAVIHLSQALEDSNDNASLFLPLILEKLSAVQNKRYYADSQLHRLKHRIMQVLLILQPYLNKESTQILYHALCDSIIQDTDQHSVRIMKEWLLIRIYLSNEELQADLWPFFDKICEERPGSASSIIGIIWHIARQLPKEKLPTFAKMALNKLGVCCMGQQFGMRLFGQIFFTKLYELLSEENNVRLEFEHFYKTTLESLRSGNFKKNPIKIDEDFFYTTFDPIQHYTLETLYYQLPRLSNVTFEEWVTKEHFEEQEFLKKMNPIPLKPSHVAIKTANSDDLLNKAVIPYSILKSNDNTKPEEIKFSEIASNMQKKMIPQKAKSPNEDIIDMYSDSTIQTKNKQEIIVVASLVEKSQNLGGIARTCEIFGVKELIISNLKQIEDKEFQALSVSADRWMKISEVKSFCLHKYLMELRDSGWTLVGAEQTANSINLWDAKYPKQTILILGNEKNGIPADIIPLLDICVEIPQFGIIRSLNVHVTNAICIWEYIKQHKDNKMTIHL